MGFTTCTSYAFYAQVLFLRNLSLSLGKTYVLQWDAVNNELERFDCHPENDASEATCTERGCIWKVRSDSVA